MKIAVFAGTSTDTEMGANLLKKYGVETLSYPMSKNPMEQTKMQYYSKTQLENLFISKSKDAISNGAESIFIYCNSLSSAIDYENISKILDIKITTPLESYKSLPNDVRSVAILAANGISAYNIDRIIHEHNDVKTISIGNLSIVESIEKQMNPRDIIESLNLKALLNYLENIQGEYKVDSLLLGCTHFPYLKSEISKITDLKIIDPADYMLKDIGLISL